ncbi:2-dehydropantoate 2-reductase N-terminal domain-containing protein [Paenibacillus dokdonensis]|uniref:2-dehydropantoate 2-reductase N-terminal domain-containing protein n=1 Tax=Paenibacillus dokdonensis TaxID=2567944 RepID=A0ABU6GPE9_9BACL|nr:2-dehydropantoate 2-reductase N-terminal domain-containing protein [Paenibacillus dokdonensis]MEC0241614.1 2-dehydropantoate 2-reductase N-terminal domain-containing protein [Paenibacillus dokdonensis]
MRILVYGAGVLGSYLAHVLVRGGNEVTVLARGKRAVQLKTNGLVIRHYFQRRNTVDEVNVIQELTADDLYDLIFVVMKYNDFPSVLSILAENQSSNIVLVGNNADALRMQNEIQEKSKAKKNIIFGFQISAGIREENGRITCIRGGGQMILGSLDGEVTIKPILESAFKKVKYKLAYHEDIDAWLKSHIVTIVALNSVSYLYDGDLKKATKDKKLFNQAISAMDEGFRLLEKLNYTITPASQVNLIRKHRWITYLGLITIHKLSFMKLIDGSFSEIAALFESFKKMKNHINIETPFWDELEKRTMSKFVSS